MRLKCPRCKRTVKDFVLPADQRKFYEEDELRNDEAEAHKPCSLCLEVINAQTKTIIT